MTITGFIKKELPSILLLLIPFVSIPFVWDLLPDTVPIHFNSSGDPDRYAGKLTGLLILPCITVGIYLLFWIIPVIDPKKRVSMDRKPLPALRFFLILTLTAFFFVTVGAMIGVEGFFSIDRFAPLFVIVIFFGLGNYLSAVQPNYFIGIRTPWTLEDPEIWRKTHRFGGRLWVFLSSVLLVLWLLLPPASFESFFVAVIIAMAIIPIVYSYALYASKSKK